MKTSKHDPRKNPQPGDRIARIQVNRNGVSGVFSRTVLERDGNWIVWTRKRPARPCICSLSQWREWAKTAKAAPL